MMPRDVNISEMELNSVVLVKTMGAEWHDVVSPPMMGVSCLPMMKSTPPMVGLGCLPHCSLSLSLSTLEELVSLYYHSLFVK